MDCYVLPYTVPYVLHLGQVCLTRSPGKHLAVFAGRAEASSIVCPHFDEVVGIWTHVLQTSVVGIPRNKDPIGS